MPPAAPAMIDETMRRLQQVDDFFLDDALLDHGERRILKGGGGVVWDGSQPLKWSNPTYGSFDNFGDSMRLLYIMSSGDQWEQPLFAMMGASEPGVAPERNDFSPMAIFSLAWMFCGYIFAINLFVGVVVDNFSRMQKEHDGSATMTQEQKQWANTMKGFSNNVPTKAMRPPENPIRRCLYRLIHSTAFDGFITAVIVANIGVMACDYWGIENDEAILSLYDRAMDVFSMIYCRSPAASQTLESFLICICFSYVYGPHTPCAVLSACSDSSNVRARASVARRRVRHQTHRPRLRKLFWGQLVPLRFLPRLRLAR